MKSLYLLFIAVAICTVSCRAKKGDPGPAGTTGATGATGADGTGTLDKQGSITGTLAYVDYKDSALSIPFTYEYITSLEDSEYEIDTEDGTSYSINTLTRVDAKDYEKYLTFSFYGDYGNDGIQTPNYGYVTFSYVTKVNNSLFEFLTSDGDGDTDLYFNSDGSSSTCDFTNFKLDTISGRLTFGYTLHIDPSNIDSNDQYDSNTPATITGNVDVILNRKRFPKVTYVP